MILFKRIIYMNAVSISYSVFLHRRSVSTNASRMIFWQSKATVILVLLKYRSNCINHSVHCKTVDYLLYTDRIRALKIFNSCG